MSCTDWLNCFDIDQRVIWNLLCLSLMSHTQLLINQLQNVSTLVSDQSCVLLISAFRYYINATMSLYSIICSPVYANLVPILLPAATISQVDLDSNPDELASVSRALVPVQPVKGEYATGCHTVRCNWLACGNV